MRLLPVVLAAMLSGAFVGQVAADQQDIAFFLERIQPVLKQHCYECHSAKADELEASLRLDSAAGLLHGGDTGPALVPGDADASLLLQAIRYQDLEMPPQGKLSQTIIADFEQWIRSGAALPSDSLDPDLPREPDYTQARQFWSFQPIQAQPLPPVQNRAWSRTAIDHFILHQLERRGLTPAPPATRRDLVRRLYFDLTGLPPTPAQIEEFVQATASDAYGQLVDRLLASPRYGERWAQHWLDVVRYAESEGFEYDRPLPGAWRFRDYVIESFNHDKPYDQFVTEQVAGDELDPADPTLRIAAGFHRLGTVRRNAGNQLVASSRNEVLTERTDIVGSAFLGLTVGCARCHDHKFDPIPQLDYYRLQAFFAATHEDNVILASREEQVRWEAATQRIQKQIDELQELLKKQQGPEEASTRARLLQLEAELPPPLPMLCSIKNDPQQLTPVHLLKRGNPDLPGPRVRMRPLGVLTDAGRAAPTPVPAHPRTQLAAWLTDSANPLTARVLVNRVWQQHFGQGFVQTANDFGNNGSRPSHPELLDHLARIFIDGGWRIKSLQRMIVLSNTYRQAANVPTAERAMDVDPDNRLLWHFPRRRLSSEEIRDAMLSVSGGLKLKAGGESVIVPVDQELIDQLYNPRQWQVTSDPTEHRRRSIYLLAKRNLRLPFLEVFDQPAALTSCSAREQSTHAPQALELLNGRLSNELAMAFADRLRREAGDEVGGQVDLAYQLAAGRAPTDVEREISLAFIRQVSLREFALAMFNLNAFLYVN